MKLQELVKELANISANVPGDSIVHIKAAGNQEIATNVIVRDTGEGIIIIIQNRKG